MVHRAEQTGRLPFLSQYTQQAWAQVVEAAPDRGKLNMTAQLQEITTRRHRLYFIRCTLRLHAQHYHLRIAGLLQARNKMLGPYRVIDPPCYRMANIPKLRQQATAQLRDDTTVYPLASGDEDAFLSLSGILFVGSAADQRYVLHEHLQNLGLAGPPAPTLHWSGHLQKGPRNTHVLPFRALAVLSAELLAIPVSTIGWAFEAVVQNCVRPTRHCEKPCICGGVLYETLPECSTAALTQVYRPTVLVRGCLPKGFHAPYLSH